MATTTTNNAWPIPQSTDLVKDGATAIASLGSAIDTTLGVYGAAGFTKINTTNFTGVSSQSVNSVFSSTYDNYRILITITTAATSGVFVMRMRAAGVDTSGTAYRNQLIKATSTSLSGVANTSGTDDWYLMTTQTSSSDATFASMDIFAPNLASFTKYHNQGGYFDSGTNPALEYNYGFLSNSTQYDGFTLIAAGNVTGTVTTYGYKK